MTPSTAYALEVLRSMLTQLDAAARSGMATLPVVPSSEISGPRQVFLRTALVSAELDVVEPRPAFGVPLVTYALWRDAWSRVAKAPWPLGDGAAAIRDPVVAARMPPLSSGLTAVATVVLTTQPATSRPSPSFLDTVAVTVFVLVAATAAVLATRQ